jgi:hypothetical protein
MFHEKIRFFRKFILFPLIQSIDFENPLQTGPYASTQVFGAAISQVQNPFFNVFEIFKQIQLFKEHLLHPQKRCRDCIFKHFTLLQAYAEEMLTLETKKNPIPLNFKKKTLQQIDALHSSFSQPQLALALVTELEEFILLPENSQLFEQAIRIAVDNPKIIK